MRTGDSSQVIERPQKVLTLEERKKKEAEKNQRFN